MDNFDSTAAEGYFVGPDLVTASTVHFRRVTNPGSATPTVSANITVTVPTTTTPNPVTHAGNTGGSNGRLDSLDQRMFAAMIRNGRLWTAHNFRVSSAGVANTAAASRNASRWYEFQNLTTTPTLIQSGSVFDNAATLAAARQYFIPSVIVTGQGHSVLGMTMAGTPVGATPVYAGRLAGDTLGTMTGPPTVAAVLGAAVSATKTVSGSFNVGGTVVYTVVLSNAGPGAQNDNPGNEFNDVLPSTLALVSASATSGSAEATVGTNTVTWNGSLAASGSVTITITATILPSAAGATVSNQGTASYDSNGDGTNDATAQTDDPGVAGAANPTVFTAAGVVATIPTLSAVGLVALFLALGAVAAVRLRKRSV